MICLVGEHYQVKLGGFTISRFLPDNGVYTLEEGELVPLVWTAPESYPPMGSGEVTCKSDVWGKWLSCANHITVIPEINAWLKKYKWGKFIDSLDVINKEPVT